MRKNQAYLPILAAMLAFGLLVGWAPGAAAQPGPNLGLPTIKPPPSSRFDMRGTIGSAGQTVAISGSGMQAGTAVQLALHVTTPSSPVPVDLQLIVVDQKLYLRSGENTPWQVQDLNPGTGGMPGGMAGMPGLTGLTPADLMQLLAGAIKVQQVGKEPIGGTPTTKDQVDIDLTKLLGNLVMDPQAYGSLAASKLMMLLWVGDADQYLYQLQLLANIQGTDASNQTQTVTADFTITFHDFGAAITITAPANAVPLNAGSGSSMLPVAVPLVPSPPPGMPRSGAPMPLTTFALLGLGCGALLLLAGVRLRRANAPGAVTRNE